MIPSALGRQLEQGTGDFLRSTFWTKTPGFASMMDRWVAQQGGIFQGPFLSLKTPFCVGPGEEFFEEVPLGYRAYAHQREAFERIDAGRHTVVATGTGSGKTECFLMPILAHCARARGRGEKGVKAVLVYPMNALATDQARRIAGMIHGADALRGKVSAGLYVGGKGRESSVMAEDWVVTRRDVMRGDPPDLLLTNYKMLDYLLLRPEDSALWKYNDPATLRFVVVDELHTFDGAQGTDLACLLRRLKARLKAQDVCCVGTSATLGKGPEAAGELRMYAEQLFGVELEDDFIVREQRQSLGDFLGSEEDATAGTGWRVPGAQGEEEGELCRVLDASEYAGEGEYLEAQERLWWSAGAGRTPTELADALWSHPFLRALLRATKNTVTRVEEVAQRIARSGAGLGGVSDALGVLRVQSFVALVSKARRQRVDFNGVKIDSYTHFMQVQMQLWVRELGRLVARVSKGDVEVAAYDDLKGEERRRYLPIAHCRECRTMGWATLMAKDKPYDMRVGNIREFYQRYFRRAGKFDARIHVMYPEGVIAPHMERNPKVSRRWLVPETMQAEMLVAGVERGEGEGMPVHVVRLAHRDGKVWVGDRDCPVCNARGGLLLVGARAATLTSAFVSQLFASRFNDDKKLLTFSDSVQDAAHRAGFFGARAARFNFRVALQKAVQSAAERGTPLTLDTARKVFAAHWVDLFESLPQEPRDTYDDLQPPPPAPTSREAAAMHFISTFIAPDMAWLRDYERMTADPDEAATQSRETKRAPKWPIVCGEKSQLFEKVSRRIDWDIFAEYTFRSQLGRTLTRIGVSAAVVDMERMTRAVDAFYTSVTEFEGALRDVPKRAAWHFLLGFVEVLKRGGAVLHSEIPDEYIKSGGAKRWSFARSLHLPPIGYASKRPVLLPMMSFGGPPSPYDVWMRQWAERVYGSEAQDTLFGQGTSGALLRYAISALTGAGILRLKETSYGLRPDAIKLTSRITMLATPQGASRIAVEEGTEDLWRGTPSILRAAVISPDEVYDVVTDRDKSTLYYARLYRQGDVERIVAREHTGLLERKEREAVERDFKRSIQRTPWSTNLLSCTPTLEMGIDIGDLSTTVLCSVPPSQANYLQRVGRAGRRDGNALVLTIATTRDHDLYFFERPEELLSGHVATPGIFLQAPAVLERQLTAYALDVWVHSEVAPSETPRKLFPQTIYNALSSYREDREDFTEDAFPGAFFAFLKRRLDTLESGFFSLFSETLADETKEYLSSFLRGKTDTESGLAWKISTLLVENAQRRQELMAERRRIRKVLRDARAQNEKIQDDESAQEVQKIERELAAKMKLVEDFDKRPLLSVLTDEGLLPNYAFPEQGVTLKSVLWRHTTDETPAKNSPKPETKGKKNTRYTTLQYEYVRPASAALREFAPRNRFYATGRSVEIDQVDMTLSNVEEWRFCPTCSYARSMSVADNVAEACPACGDEGWADVGQTQAMMRLRGVYATASDRKSRLSDDSEERAPRIYLDQLLIVCSDQDVTSGWIFGGEGATFGFDHVRQATFRQINFGELGESSEPSRIAGREAVRRGFSLCASCGMVQEPETKKSPQVAKRPARPAHHPGCKHYKRPEKAKILDCLYLYREFQSEALRLLLPFVGKESSKRKRESFIAALNLGLKKTFGGKVDHLATCLYDEPIDDSEERKQYLVVYDTVPGGTGYLKQLVQRGALMDVLRSSLEVMRSCACQHRPDTDGCYRCVFAYRGSRDMDATSRTTAIEIISDLVQRASSLEETQSIGGVSVNPLLESVLEEMFIEALGSNLVDGVQAKVERAVIRSKPGYRLTLKHSETERPSVWNIELQVPLGPPEGVSVETRPDCVFWPARPREGQRPIAVYLDGWTFHRDRVSKDMLQRMALARSGKFWTWSLTWSDIQSVLQSRMHDLDTPSLTACGAHFIRFAKNALQGTTEPALRSFLHAGSFAQLLHTLADPTHFERLRNAAHAQALCMVVTHKHKDAKQDRALQGSHAKWIKMSMEDTLLDHLRDRVRIQRLARTETSDKRVTICAVGGGKAIDQSGLIVWLDDRGYTHLHDKESREARTAWNIYLRQWNTLQFLPNAYAITTSSGEERPTTMAFPTIPETQSDGAENAALLDVLEDLDPDLTQLASLIATLHSAGAPLPTVGDELRGVVLEAAWNTQKIAFVWDGDDTAQYAADFRREGWTVHFVPTDLEDQNTRENIAQSLLESLLS